jgi:hypothetical protein
MNEGKIYRHYKGGTYRYLCVARLEWQPDTHVVVYQSLADNSVWVRATKDFHGDAWLSDGSLVKRFEVVT